MEFVLKVNNKEFKYWTDVEVNLQLNSVASTFSLTGLWDENTKELFKPFSWLKCELWLFDEKKGINEKLITGRLVNPGLSLQKLDQPFTIQGMSLPGIFEQINIPTELYPLKYNGYSLAQIAQKICDHFDVPMKIHDGAWDDAHKKFEEVECSPTQSIISFMRDLGKKRGITIAHDNEGNLFIYKIVDIIPATSFFISSIDPILDIGFSPDSQGVHSHCTAYKQAEADDVDTKSGQKVTVKSPFVDYYLPIVVSMDKDERGTLREYAEKQLAKEAFNFPISIRKEGFDFDGRIVRAGFYLEVEAPKIFWERTKVLVEDMVFRKSAKEPETLYLNAVLVCAYTGKLPSKSPFI